MSLMKRIESNESFRQLRTIRPHTYYSYFYPRDESVIEVVAPVDGKRHVRELEDDEVDYGINLSCRRKEIPAHIRRLTFLAREFERLSFYREWNFGRNSPARLPQRVDSDSRTVCWRMPPTLVSCSNEMMNRPGLKGTLLERMTDFYPFIQDIPYQLDWRDPSDFLS